MVTVSKNYLEAMVEVLNDFYPHVGKDTIFTKDVKKEYKLNVINYGDGKGNFYQLVLITIPTYTETDISEVLKGAELAQFIKGMKKGYVQGQKERKSVAAYIKKEGTA